MIIGLSGYARSGKDTVAEYLVGQYKFVQKSFAEQIKLGMYLLDPILVVDEVGPMRYKNLVDSYGLDFVKEKYPEARRLLQVFGTEVGRDLFGKNFWVDLTLNQVNLEHTVISDVRFINEADSIREKGGQIWRVNRSAVKPVTNHQSEVDLDGYNFDLVIDNNKSILDLHLLIDQEFNKLMSESLN